VPIGKAKILRSGDDVTLVSYGISLNYVIEAANVLSKKGISSEVIDLRSLRPLDTETIIDSVKRTNRCVTIEQGFPICSIGNYVSSIIMQNAFDYLDAPVINCNGKDVPMPYAANLEQEALLRTEDIVNAVMEVTYRS
jgi:pyruvate dehydrogenase E1 component beta subunit